MHILLFLLSVAAFAQAQISDVSGQSAPVANFTQPGDADQGPSNVTYSVGDTVHVEWKTNLPAVDVYITNFLDVGRMNMSRIAANMSETSMDWEVEIPQPMKTMKINGGERFTAHLSLYKPGDKYEPLDFSSRFNITSSPTGGESGGPPTAIPTYRENGLPQLSFGAIAGISLGASAALTSGVICLALYLRRRKEKKRTEMALDENHNEEERSKEFGIIEGGNRANEYAYKIWASKTESEIPRAS